MCKVEWQQQVNARMEVAKSVPTLYKQEQKALFLDANTRVHVTDASIDVAFGKDQSTSVISTAAALVRRVNELRMSIAPDDRFAKDQIVDRHLVMLVAQGFAARAHLLNGNALNAPDGYDQKHLNRLIRVSWLAPDIISAILGGRHPVQLTARHLLRCANIPLNWQQQRSFLGFN
jgi:site-specific DNA recombinase